MGSCYISQGVEGQDGGGFLALIPVDRSMTLRGHAALSPQLATTVWPLLIMLFMRSLGFLIRWPLYVPQGAAVAWRRQFENRRRRRVGPGRRLGRSGCRERVLEEGVARKGGGVGGCRSCRNRIIGTSRRAAAAVVPVLSLVQERSLRLSGSCSRIRFCPPPAAAHACSGQPSMPPPAAARAPSYTMPPRNCERPGAGAVSKAP